MLYSTSVIYFFIKYFLVFAGEGYASSNPKAKTISPKGGKKDEQV